MAIACAADFRDRSRGSACRASCSIISTAAPMARSRSGATSPTSPTIALRQRVLVDVSKIDLTTRLFGRDLAMPVALGPVGLTGMYARRGEAQAARAASAKGIPSCLSSLSVCGLREVTAASGAPIWFQLYVIKDRGYMAELLAVAKEVGCTALVFTVDLPVPGRALSRRPFRPDRPQCPPAPARPGARPIRAGSGTWRSGAARTASAISSRCSGKASGLDDYVGWIGRNFDASIAWPDIAWIRAHWQGPLIDQGRARSRGRARGGPARRRRHRRLQPWRPPARRRPLHRPRAARDRRRGRRRPHHPRRRRRPLRARRAAHARARRQRRPARPRLGVRAGRARRAPASPSCSTSSRPSCASRCSSPASPRSTGSAATSSGSGGSTDPSAARRSPRRRRPSWRCRDRPPASPCRPGLALADAARPGRDRIEDIVVDEVRDRRARPARPPRADHRGAAAGAGLEAAGQVHDRGAAEGQRRAETLRPPAAAAIVSVPSPKISLSAACGSPPTGCGTLLKLRYVQTPSSFSAALAMPVSPGEASAIHQGFTTQPSAAARGQRH